MTHFLLGKLRRAHRGTGEPCVPRHATLERQEEEFFQEVTTGCMVTIVVTGESSIIMGGHTLGAVLITRILVVETTGCLRVYTAIYTT